MTNHLTFQLTRLIKSGKVAQHRFFPFLKMVIKTRRYRYESSLNPYDFTAEERKPLYTSLLKKRPISFASHFDSYIYAYYSFVLNERYQSYIKANNFDECVLAYRTDLRLCNIQFAKKAFDSVRGMADQGSIIVVALDIKGYFDNINHKILKEKWLKVLDSGEKLPDDQYLIFKTLTRYHYINYKSLLKHFNIDLEKQVRYKDWRSILDFINTGTDEIGIESKFRYLKNKNLIVENKVKEDGRYRGIPQGSSMSSTLSNVYLVDFDQQIKDMSRDLGFNYFRYCDDLLLVCRECQAETIEKLVLNKLKDYNLKVQEKKTERILFTNDSKGRIQSFNLEKLQHKRVDLTLENEDLYYKKLQYLGFEFDGKEATIRSSSLSRYFRNMKDAITTTVSRARGNRSKSKVIFTKKLRSGFTHYGKNNFISYALRASRKEYVNIEGKRLEGLNSPAIRKQIKSHEEIMKYELRNKDNLIQERNTYFKKKRKGEKENKA